MTVTTPDQMEALFDRLAHTEGKAEIIDGEIVQFPLSEPWPGSAADEILASLWSFMKQTKTGIACGGNKIFRVNLPNRQSFSPDAAYFTGTMRAMQHYNRSPTFAVEVRSAGDYGPRAERQMAAKRADYFAAGTLVVWDVDLLSQDVVRVYRPEAPTEPAIFRPGDIADAEPAVPNWTMPVNDLLPADWRYPFVEEDGEEKEA